MNQDQQFLVKNLQNMIKYIQQETEKKVQIIKKEAGKDADLGRNRSINKLLKKRRYSSIQKRRRLQRKWRRSLKSIRQA